MSGRRSDREWTIVQLLYHDPVPISERHPLGWEHRQEMYVVEVGTRRAAESIVFRNIGKTIDNPHETHYYPRNYVDQYRSLKAAGRVLS